MPRQAIAPKAARGIIIDRGEKTETPDKKVTAATRKAATSTVRTPSGVAAPPPIAGLLSLAPVPWKNGEIATKMRRAANARSRRAAQSGKKASLRTLGSR